METKTLKRVDGYFECPRCLKQIKKDQAMKDHAKKCTRSHHANVQSTSISHGGQIDPNVGQKPVSLVHSQAISTPTGKQDSHIASITQHVDHVGETESNAKKSCAQEQINEPTDPAPTVPSGRSFRVSSSVESDATGVPVSRTAVRLDNKDPLDIPDDSEFLPTQEQRPKSTVPKRLETKPFFLPTCPNKWEQQVLIDRFTITDDPLLKKTPYIINSQHHKIICLDCKHAVSVKNAQTHVRKQHRCLDVQSDLDAALTAKYPSLTSDSTYPGEVCDPVFGLAIPLEEHVVCTRCQRGYVDIHSWQSHSCSKAQIDIGDRPPHFTSLVQTFFLGNKRRYFPIRTPCSSPSTLDDFVLWKSQFHGQLAVSEEVIEQPDSRQAHLFLEREGWIAHVAGCNLTKLLGLVSLPAVNDPHGALVPELRRLLRNIQSIIAQGVFHVRRLLGRRPSNNHDDLRIIHHRDVNPETLSRYTRTVAALVLFVLRCHQGWDSEYSMKLTNEQGAACQALLEVLHLPGTRDEPNSFVPDTDADDLFGDDDTDELLEEPLEDPENEVHEDVESILQDKSPFIPDSAAIGEVTQTPIQARLLDVLLALYTHLPAGKDDKFWSPIMRFIVLYSIRKDGKWLNARQITHGMAGLLFCGRLLMMVLMYQEVLRNPDTRYSEAYKVVAPYLDEDHEAPIPTMYILLRPLHKFSAAEDGIFKFTALSFNGDNIIFDGQVLYLHSIRRFVEVLINEIRDQIKSELLFGIDVVDVDWFPAAIYEEPRNTHVSYSAFDDPRNPFHRNKDALLRLILTDPRLRGIFHYVDQNDHVVWKPGPCFAYMEKAHDVEMKLFSATQTTAGQTGRIIEIVNNLVRNISGGSLRNVLILFQYLVLVGTYNKTSHMTERDDLIVRVPLPEVGRLWVLYLTIVRPLIAVWQGYFNGPSAAHRAHHRLFAGPHRPVTASELSRSLSSHTERILGIKISVSQWRHIVSWFMNYNCSRFQAFLTTSGQSVLARQMGHGENTHNLYSNDSRLPSCMNFHHVLQTMLLSGIWHEMLGFTPTLLDSMTDLHPGLADLRKSGNHRLAMKEHINTVSDVHDIAANVVKMITPELHRIYTQSRANDLASFLDVMGIKVQTDVSPPPSQQPSYVAHASRIGTLRRFLNNENATFKHAHQALSVELMAQGNSSLLLVAPTGSGKTLPILLCASQLDSGRTTVIILPLLAMHDEYHSRTKQHHITCETWSHKLPLTSPPQILLVAVECSGWNDLKTYIHTLFLLDRLSRIVVDEAHLLLKHESFRPCVDLLTHFGQVPVPLILMTATLPRTLEQKLFSKLGRSVYKVLRRSTERPEIAHAMIDVNREASGLDSEDFVAQNIHGCVQRLKGSDRALLFCLSRNDCDKMAQKLGWKPYHSDVDISDRREHLRAWRSGELVGLVCTSMLNCCLDYPAVRFIFHLGVPRDAMDYGQAVGRGSRDNLPCESIVFFDSTVRRKIHGEDPFGEAAMRDTLYDSSTCRRIRLALFLDGSASPCSMLAGGELCDVCANQISDVPPKGKATLFPDEVGEPSRDGDLTVTQNTLITMPEQTSRKDTAKDADIGKIRGPGGSMPLGKVNEPISQHPRKMFPSFQILSKTVDDLAQGTGFSNHLLATLALKNGHTLTSENGLRIGKACEILAVSCVSCWVQGMDYHSHRLRDCPKAVSIETNASWREWKGSLSFPRGVCFYCGFPLTMKHTENGGQDKPIHAHECDKTCHWVNVLKPLAFMVLRDTQLYQVLIQSDLRKGQWVNTFGNSYARWVCQTGENGILNLLNVFLLMLDFRGFPHEADIGPRSEP